MSHAHCAVPASSGQDWFVTPPPASPGDAELAIAAGDILPEVPGGTVLRLQAGAMRLHPARPQPQTQPAAMALAGDLVGTDALTGQPGVLHAVALVPCVLRPMPAWTPEDRLQLLPLALSQSWRQCQDMTRLRTGSATERIRHLLLLLARSHADEPASDNDQPCALPSLRDMAGLVDSTHETVCRVISNLCRMDVLHERKAASVRVDVPALRTFKPLHGMTAGLTWIGR